MILPAFLFLVVGQPLQINLRLNNNPAALYRDGNGHPGDKTDSSSQRPLRLIAEGGLDLPFYSSHFDIRPAGVTVASGTGKAECWGK
jgi:hypothetical protein